MQIQKKYLPVFFSTLNGTDGVLSLSDSRVRDVFFKHVLETTQQFEKDRKTIYEKFCNKKEDGTPDTTDDKYTFANDVLDEANKELEILGNEDVEFVTAFPAKIKEIIELSAYKPKTGESEQIDHIISKL